VTGLSLPWLALRPRLVPVDACWAEPPAAPAERGASAAAAGTTRVAYERFLDPRNLRCAFTAIAQSSRRDGSNAGAGSTSMNAAATAATAAANAAAHDRDEGGGGGASSRGMTTTRPASTTTVPLFDSIYANRPLLEVGPG
jgi:hypothetical protein